MFKSLLILLVQCVLYVKSEDTEQIEVDAVGRQKHLEVNVVSDADPQPHPLAMSCQFENKSGEKVLLWWSNGGDGVLQAEMEPEAEMPINTYVGHEFYFTPEEGEEVLYRVIMDKHMVLVTLLPPDEMAQRNEEFEQKKSEWLRQYLEKSGQPWRNYYPRGAVEHFMFNITHMGQEFESTSHHPYFKICSEEFATEEIKERLKAQESNTSNMSLYQNEQHVFVQDKNSHTIWCRNASWLDKKTHLQREELYSQRIKEPTFAQKWDEMDHTLKLVVLCDEPRVIQIKNFISDDECDHIITVGKSLGLKRSTVSEEAFETEDRTSSTCWLERDHSPVLDHIVQRIGDIVRIHPSKLFINVSSESLQLVHYKSGELYKAHFDYGTDRPNQRFLTFLMYLNTPEEGGNTSFPNAADRCRDANGYFGVKPTKGTAVFFYDLFSDGNVDQSSLHFAEPPVNGSEKWMTNLWIWDPYFG